MSCVSEQDWCGTPARSLSDDYWEDTRRPLSCLAFLLPWMGVYEGGVLLMSQQDVDHLRNGADFWLRALLTRTGFSQTWLLPVLVAGILLVWHIVRRHPWRIRLETQVGMLAESLVLAAMLVAAGQLHHLLFVSLQSVETDPRLLATAPAAGGLLASGPAVPHAVSCIGAGVYEEVLFRLLLVPAALTAFRLLEFPERPAAAMAAITTAFVFALAHHVGPAADAFSLYTFSFRAAAGLFFAGIFFLRGFGIAVGCHAAYDILIGVLLVPNG